MHLSVDMCCEDFLGVGGRPRPSGGKSGSSRPLGAVLVVLWRCFGFNPGGQKWPLPPSSVQIPTNSLQTTCRGTQPYAPPPPPISHTHSTQTLPTHPLLPPPLACSIYDRKHLRTPTSISLSLSHHPLSSPPTPSSPSPPPPTPPTSPHSSRRSLPPSSSSS